MNKRIQSPLLFLFFLGYFAFGQSGSDFPVLTMPKELAENSNMVIRHHELQVEVESIDEMTVTHKTIVTVLNKVGHRYVNTFVHYDNHTKVNDASARIYDANGKEIKKFKKRDFTDVSAVDGSTLYSDSRVLYIDFTPVSYPYTMEFEYEYETSTTALIPRWNPIPGYYIGVEKSIYTVAYPTSLGLQKKEKNFAGYSIEDKSTEGEVSYIAKNLEPIEYESLSPSINSLRPYLMISLNNLTMDGVEGSYTNWNEFGQWMYDHILQGKDQVDVATQEKIKALTANAKTDIEKAKIVYKFMQDKTRYISVQVGIGGIQPIAANQVDKVGYGDCKGLTNYTKALLDVVGVKSYYVHVQADPDEVISFEKDFASLEQGNHVILNIPNGEEDLWLECTSQSKPFGYLGSFTDNRDVLVVTSEGGVIKKTPSYLNDQNLRTTIAKIQLDPNGNLTSEVDITSKGVRYDARYELETEPLSELKKFYKSAVWEYNNNLEIKSVAHKNDRDSIVFNEKVALDIANYATISDTDYLIKVNVFDRNTFVPKRYRDRKYGLKIERGYKDIDQYTFQIPEGYQIEALPPEKIIKNKFGEYMVNFKKVDDKTFTYQKSLLIKAGEYPKEDYKNYRKFRKSVAKYDNIRISLTKKP
jgi:transglutaminase-like putative cysteine protease